MRTQEVVVAHDSPSETCRLVAEIERVARPAVHADNPSTVDPPVAMVAKSVATGDKY